MKYINNIKLEDIDLLINDLDLEKKGYKFRLVIDTADVIDYTFPLGKYFDKTPSMDDIGDNKLAYEYVFGKYNPIIMDEYGYELELLEIEIRKYIVDNAKKKKNLFDISLNNNIIIEDNIVNNYSFLLAVALSSKPIFEDFNDVINDRLQIESFKDDADNNLFKETFIQSKKELKWWKKAFEEWYDIQVEKGKKTFTRGNLINTIRDIKVIERLCYINKETIQKKYIFYYFSNANKSKEFFKLDNIKEKIPKLEDKPEYHFFRQPKHSFFLFVLQNIKNKQAQLNSLKTIFESNNDITLGELIHKHPENEAIDIIKKAYDTIIDNFENKNLGYLINQTNEYQEKIEKFIKDLKDKNIEKLKKEFEKLYKIIKNQNIPYITSDLAINLLFHKDLSDTIEEHFKENELSGIARGNDYVNGTFHHIPLLLFLNNPINFEDYYKILDFLIKPKNYRDNNKSKLTDLFKLLIENKAKDNIKDQENLILIKAFVLILLNHKSEHNIEKILLLLEESYYALKIQQKDKKEISQLSEYIYILSWFYRRVNNLEKALKFTNEGIKENTTDPRFYHSKSLIYYNKYIKNDEPDLKDNVSFKKINSNIIDNVNEAIDKYEYILKSKDVKLRKYIIGNMISLLNLKLYVITIFILKEYKNENKKKNEIIELSKIEGFGYSKIEDLRKELLDKIRHLTSDLFKELDMEDEKNNKLYAEIAHTEAVLEIVEAIDYKNKNNKDYKNKIEESKKAIDKAIEFAEKNHTLYENTKKLILDISNQLQQKI